ncbi:hypothetical protein BK816_03350 [Boudabousia tangfeifanii]|uniref:Glycosyltransferase 2-like domain-containing protein n=1 Tax=Boudabousia tangfeifanii TaxID=1912795 RepID=A0A1D9MJI7_9ACTO|nr:glycosyltransferase [Boudabousia tangfeifanii]AOZ72446.1 hypothetical protein BK816_03350 [Boudabousia tangfeifanii]
MRNNRPKVVVALVAYNRAPLLKECLDALSVQSVQPTAVVAVDNASSDQTPEILAAHPVVSHTLRLERNTGGAGGYAAAIALALEKAEADWVWIMDDDTIPSPTALEKLIEVRDSYPEPVTLLASKAIWTDGNTHPMNTHRQRPFASKEEIQAAKQYGAMPVRAASFVSILVRAEAIRANGLPIADYFLWNDDLEYTARLLRDGVGLYVPASVVTHKTKQLASATDDPGERFYYEARNKRWFLKSDHLRARDRILWGGATVVRWGKMFLKSKQRKQLWQLGYKGWKDGSQTPKTNEEYFADLPKVRQVISGLDDQTETIQNNQGTPKILMAGSSGGHLAQLRNLSYWYQDLDVTWLTFDTEDAKTALEGERVIWATHSPERKWQQLIKSAKLARRTLDKSRPDLIISAGASLGIMALLYGKMLGVPTLYIEVFDRIKLRSLSGRIAYRLADEFCVQWEEQKKLYPKAKLVGPLL